VLAISMTYFSGRVSGTNVLLNWTTQSAQNIDHFDVERSFDGSPYSTIGTVQSRGAGNTVENYSYTDLSVQPGQYSYRLTEVHTDGATGYSSVVIVNPGAAVTVSAMSMYPNPAIDHFTIQPGSAVSGVCAVSLIDLSGRTVYSQQVTAAGGSAPVTIGSRLTPGIYLVRLVTTTGAVCGKIFIE